jgi:hypothetical protein
MTKLATKTVRSAKQTKNVPAKRASRGPKAGSARSNQSAVLTNPDRIKTVVGTRSGNGVFVEAEGGAHVVIADWQNNAQTTKLAKVGQPLAALKAHLATIAKPSAKLARGVDVHNAPHSAKAVRDNRASEGKASTSAGRKARGDAAKVAGKPAKAAKANGTRSLAKVPQKMTILVKVKDAGLAAGSGREAKLAFAAKCKTTADFLGKTVTDSAGKEHKCDAGALSGMVKRGHVRLG